VKSLSISEKHEIFEHLEWTLEMAREKNKNREPLNTL
jgi:hypothetical protein